MKCRPHLTRSSLGTTQPGSTKSSDGHGPTARGQRSGFAVCQHLTPEALRGGCLPGSHRLGPPRRCAGCSPEGSSLTIAETPVWGPGCRGRGSLDPTAPGCSSARLPLPPHAAMPSTCVSRLLSPDALARGTWPRAEGPPEPQKPEGAPSGPPGRARPAGSSISDFWHQTGRPSCRVRRPVCGTLLQRPQEAGTHHTHRPALKGRAPEPAPVTSSGHPCAEPAGTGQK